MAKKNEKLETLMELAIKAMLMRNNLIWTVVRFGLCMALAIVALIGYLVGRMLSV